MYNEELALRIRQLLSDVSNVEEKKMMGGLTFMIDDKMCVGIWKDNLMCRIDPAMKEELLEKPGCREMEFTKRPMKGFVFVEPEGTSSGRDLKYWVSISLEYNKKVEPSKKKRKINN